MKKRDVSFIIFSAILIVAIVTSVVIGEKKQREMQEKAILSQMEQEKTKESNKDNIENKQQEKQPVVEAKQEKKNKFDGLNLKSNDIGVSVLYYHSVDDVKDNELIISKQKFREQMKFLKDNGYTTLTMEELYKYVKNNEKVPEKSVVITFDDGYADNYKNAYPILKEFGFNATIYMVTDWIDKDPYYLNSSQLKELEANGIEIQSHTGAHDHLASLTKEKQLDTLKRSKEKLEKLLNKEIRYIAYPFGEYNETTKKLTEELGYKMAFATSKGWADKTDNLFAVNRVYVSAFTTMDSFKQRVTTSKYQ